MAPVIQRLNEVEWAEATVLNTAQHRDLVAQALQPFAVRPDFSLDVMLPGQSLATLTARLIEGFERFLAERQSFDAILAQGDTTSAMTGALAAFYHHVPFGHVEAGLRTHDLENPFPEEANRTLISRLARWHFAPTALARDHLLREGIAPAAITVTGNTVIDALMSIAPRADNVGVPLDPGKRLILVTTHRRESFGAPLAAIVSALKTIAEERADIQILLPVHPNPNVKAAVGCLEGHPRITLTTPLDYLQFVGAMKRAYLILTDSGGIQEEAPALGKPVLVLRNETERQEAIEAGVVRQVGTDTGRILDGITELLDNRRTYDAMAVGSSPYGDGRAAERITRHLADHFLGTRPS